MSNPGANTVYGKGPMFVIIGPEHAATLKRDGYTIDSIREELWKRSRVHALADLEGEPRTPTTSTGHKPDGDWLHDRPLAARHPHHRGRRTGQALGLHPVVRRHDRRLRAHRPMTRMVRLAGRR